MKPLNAVRDELVEAVAREDEECKFSDTKELAMKTIVRGRDRIFERGVRPMARRHQIRPIWVEVGYSPGPTVLASLLVVKPRC